MRVTLPLPDFSKQWAQRITDALNLAFINAVSDREAVTKLFLQSPNGSVYKIAVDDAGTLVVTIHDTTERY